MAKVDCTCAHCGTPFKSHQCLLKEGKGRCCSQACGYAHRRANPKPKKVYGPLTQSRLKALLTYDPDTGIFTWLVSLGKAKAGSIAGYIDNGYVAIVIDRRKYPAHRLAWLFVHGEWPKGDTDHRNEVRNDNRITNLRDVSRAVNLQNRKNANASNKSSGLLGSSYNIRTGVYHAQIETKGKSIHLGCYKTAEEAHAAYLVAKRIHHPDA